MKPNTDETLEDSSSDDDNSHFNGGENDETVKTFKDLVGSSHRERRRDVILATNTSSSIAV